ncbi:MAG TPA: glycosyltransferase family 4 protein [Pirellulaceae bacterium]|nr:glycosyltransferase family 4 protein [Pirellulaceae bacterium]HMO93439.1 glycosyltransferase family 4 protein [Pirellulaceae bacterium]HMP68453.1 glycosyltransferase family 4 protein [Pirellulaceae bacterium]
MKQRVLFTVDSLYNGGTEKSLLDITSRFTRINPVFCCFYQHRQLLADYERVGLKVHFLGMEKPYGFLKAAEFLDNVLKQENPHLVIGHLLRSELISRWVCHRRKYPILGTFVNDTYSPAAYAILNTKRKLKTNFFRCLNRVSAKWCTHFISNSSSIGLSNAAALGIDSNKISVIPRGRDETIYHPGAAQRNGPFNTILNVARTIERKGQQELIHGFARIAPDFPGVNLQIAGDGTYRPSLEAEVKRLGMNDRVRFLGNVTNIPELLRQADVFVFPSHYEGFSGALIEAMLTGMPIIASDIPMNLEAIEDGKTALTFPVKDADACAERIRWCLENPDKARQLGQAAREKALRCFTLDRVAKQFEDLLLELLERFGRRNS